MAAFDAHRYGTYEPLDRKCLTVHELTLSSKFERNTRGVWSLSAGLIAARSMRIGSAERHV